MPEDRAPVLLPVEDTTAFEARRCVEYAKTYEKRGEHWNAKREESADSLFDRQYTTMQVLACAVDSQHHWMRAIANLIAWGCSR